VVLSLRFLTGILYALPHDLTEQVTLIDLTLQAQMLLHVPTTLQLRNYLSLWGLFMGFLMFSKQTPLIFLYSIH
jgi:hypothetical protein